MAKVKTKSVISANFHKVLLVTPHYALWFTPNVFSHVKGLVKLHNPVGFLKTAFVVLILETVRSKGNTRSNDLGPSLGGFS